MKINVSTQFIASLLATLEIAKQEKKKISKIKDLREIEVSPYIIENKTVREIELYRKIDGIENIVKL